MQGQALYTAAVKVYSVVCVFHPAIVGCMLWCAHAEFYALGFCVLSNSQFHYIYLVSSIKHYRHKDGSS